MLEGAGTGQDLPGQLPVVAVQVAVHADVGHRLGGLHEMGDLRGTVRGQREDGQRPEPEQGQAHHGQVGAVGQLDDDPVPRGDAQSTEPRGQPVGGQVEPAVRQGAVRSDDRGPGGQAGVAGPAAQQFTGPVPLGPVPRGQGFGPGRTAVEHGRTPVSVRLSEADGETGCAADGGRRDQGSDGQAAPAAGSAARTRATTRARTASRCCSR